MFYSVMDPHRSFSNSIVKGYSGEDTKRGASWENNTMSKFLESEEAKVFFQNFSI